MSHKDKRSKLDHSMMQSEQVAILFPIVAGSITALCTILIHSVALGTTVRFFRRERSLGRVGSVVWMNLGVFVLAISFAFVAHLTEIALWAALFLICGEFRSFGVAFYHSAVNYTTLGYGDLIMTPSWKLLGPLEAADGALMFGVSTAMIFAIAQRLMHAKFADL
jgi:Ion channel